MLPVPETSQQAPKPWRLHPLAASLLLLSSAVGVVVLTGVLSVALIPILLGAGVIVGWLLALLLLGWAAIEGLAALERWMETDNRFRR